MKYIILIIILLIIIALMCAWLFLFCFVFACSRVVRRTHRRGHPHPSHGRRLHPRHGGVWPVLCQYYRAPDARGLPVQTRRPTQGLEAEMVCLGFNETPGIRTIFVETWLTIYGDFFLHPFPLILVHKIRGRLKYMSSTDIRYHLTTVSPAIFKQEKGIDGSKWMRFLKNGHKNEWEIWKYGQINNCYIGCPEVPLLTIS